MFARLITNYVSIFEKFWLKAVVLQFARLHNLNFGRSLLVDWLFRYTVAISCKYSYTVRPYHSLEWLCLAKLSLMLQQQLQQFAVGDWLHEFGMNSWMCVHVAFVSYCLWMWAGWVLILPEWWSLWKIDSWLALVVNGACAALHLLVGH